MKNPLARKFMVKTIKENPAAAILFFFILVNLLIGLEIAPDFGISTDEYAESAKARPALDMYTGQVSQDMYTAFDEAGLPHDKFYGTANIALIGFIEQYLFPNIDLGTKVVAHYCYFVYFQLAVLTLFYLSRFFFNQWTSLAVALLFGTQPLLFGHGFINPKDIPLLTTFLLAVTAGFWMVRRWVETEAERNAENSPLSEKTRQRRFLVILLGMFVLLWSTPAILRGVLWVVAYSYQTSGESLLGRLFETMTTSGSLEGYLALAQHYFFKIFRWIAFSTPIILLALFYKAKQKGLFGKKITPMVFLASAAWGWALSTRSLAIAAGGLVGIYALTRLKTKSLLPLMVYTMTASLMSFISWPFLWLNGIKSYFQGLVFFSAFPWSGQVLFDGQYYAQNALPARYIPQLMAIQFTEPLVILAAAGFFLGVYWVARRKLAASAWLLVYGWLALPILYTVFGHPTLYNNFRHFLFITPPLFLMAGLLLEQAYERIKPKVVYAAIVLVLIAPGIFWTVRLHPMQYMYYNAFVGNVAGAGDNYALDYWNVGYKDAMAYVTDNVPEGNKILVWKDNHLGIAYSGEKYYIFEAHTNVSPDQYRSYDYAIMPSNRYTMPFDDYQIVYTVTIENHNLIDVIKIGAPDS